VSLNNQKNKMKKVTLLFVLLLALTGYGKAQTYSDFTLPDLDGNDITLSRLLDKGPVMISFWATWCSPCKEEMKKMNDVYLKYKDKGFQYVALNIDNQKSASKVKSFVTAQSFAFIVLMDNDKKVFEAYSGKDEMPYSIIIDKNKNIVTAHTGFKTGDEVQIAAEVEKLVNK